MNELVNKMSRQTWTELHEIFKKKKKKILNFFLNFFFF